MAGCKSYLDSDAMTALISSVSSLVQFIEQDKWRSSGLWGRCACSMFCSRSPVNSNSVSKMADNLLSCSVTSQCICHIFRTYAISEIIGVHIE